jgi:hypothetical protein
MKNNVQGQQPYGQVMRELHALQRSNAQQISALVAQHQSFAADLQEFITAVKLMQESQKAQDTAIAKLQDRNEEADKRAAEHRFTLGNNVASWGIGLIVFFLGWLVTGHIQFVVK